VMMYLGCGRLHAVTSMRFGRVVDAVSVPWPDGLKGRDALKLCEEVATMGLQRRTKLSADGAVPSRLAPCGMAKDYPLVWEFLTKTRWGKDDPRETGTMFVMMQDGLLKASLSDRDSDHVLWVAACSLTELFQVVEAALGDPGADWRVDRKAIAKRGNAGANGKLDRRSGR
jgi:hypothetical protein